jgi:iron only hydrogenase large subunit-like protein
MAKCLGVDFTHLPDGRFDSPLGDSSGAADIFGATGGVMEAALRTAYEKITGKPLEHLDFESVRGVRGVKEADVRIDGTTVSIGVANGLNNAKHLLDRVIRGEKTFHIIEIMACPGGCVAGGGQPYPPRGMDVLDPELAKLRARALYAIDASKRVRKSHENPELLQLYAEYLGEPNGHLSHELLHTTYRAQEPRGIR